MICPYCRKQFPNPTAQKGGQARVPKGFANNPRAQAKAQATRRANAKKKICSAT